MIEQAHSGNTSHRLRVGDKSLRITSIGLLQLRRRRCAPSSPQQLRAPHCTGPKRDQESAPAKCPSYRRIMQDASETTNASNHGQHQTLDCMCFPMWKVSQLAQVAVGGDSYRAAIRIEQRFVWSSDSYGAARRETREFRNSRCAKPKSWGRDVGLKAPGS